MFWQPLSFSKQGALRYITRRRRQRWRRLRRRHPRGWPDSAPAATALRGAQCGLARLSSCPAELRRGERGDREGGRKERGRPRPLTQGSGLGCMGRGRGGREKTTSAAAAAAELFKHEIRFKNLLVNHAPISFSYRSLLETRNIWASRAIFEYH